MDQKKLNIVLKDHQSWLESNNKKGLKAVLWHANLKGLSFEQKNLKRVEFNYANLEKANLKGATLENADLHKTNLKMANLEDANLKKAFLRKANLESANLEKANLEGAYLKYSNLRNAKLKFANLQKSELQWAILKGADLHEANFADTDLLETDLSETCLEKTQFQKANLTGAQFEGAQFNDTSLKGVRIEPDDIKQLPVDVVKNYGHTFTILGSGIARAIELPPEYLQAGISILSYFGNILSKKYPEQAAKINIEIDRHKVTMTVAPFKGDAELIEKALDDYSLVVAGKLSPEEFTDDPNLNLELKQEIIYTRTRIGDQNNHSQHRQFEIDKFNQLFVEAIRRSSQP